MTVLLHIEASDFYIGRREAPRGVLDVDATCTINGKVHLQYAVAANGLTRQSAK
jgi:hypothetical protein